MWRDIIELIATTNSGNPIGDTVSTPTTKEVFANKKSIRQSEFYQAAANGLKPEIMFEIRAADYNEEKELEYEGKPYSIIRTYSASVEFVELICTGLVNRAVT